MFQPFVCSPHQAFPKEKVENDTVQCACGRPTALKDTNLVWASKGGNDPEYFAICNAGCYTVHCTMGHA